MSNYNLRYIVFFLFLFLPETQNRAQVLGFELEGDAKSVDIPFDFYNNLIVIPVILNEQLPLRFILDTGVRTTILTEKAYSDILNLPYLRKYTVTGLGGEKAIDAYVTTNVSLTLPGVKGKGHAMLVLEEDYLELRNYLGTEVHGILGYEIFSRFVVEIDYDNRVLSLIKPQFFKPRRSHTAIPMTIEDTKPYIMGKVAFHDGTSLDVKLLVDTGASHGLQLEVNSDERIKVPKKNVYTSLGRGLGGSIEGRVARLKSFHIGDLCWEDPIATFPEANPFLDSLKGGGVFRNGSIGGEILSRFKATLNFPGQMLYLRKGSEFRKSFSYNLSGLVVRAKGSLLSTFEIVQVMENSVGEKAGIREGDIILSINSIDASKMHLNRINGFLNSRENKKLKMVILRDGKKITKRFRLKSLI